MELASWSALDRIVMVNNFELYIVNTIQMQFIHSSQLIPGGVLCAVLLLGAAVSLVTTAQDKDFR